MEIPENAYNICLQCLHRFCQECMEQSLRVLQNECPSCRARVPSRRSCQKDERFDAVSSVVDWRVNLCMYAPVCESLRSTVNIADVP